MKDSVDKQTLDLFGTPKKRGRPSTGKATSNADRQAAYRRRKRTAPLDVCKENLNLWINYQAKHALERLAKSHGKTQSEFLSELVLSAQEQYLRGIDIDTTEWEHYFK
jgi:hypothetical protein